MVELVDTRHSECRATRGVGVRISPWLLTNELVLGLPPPAAREIDCIGLCDGCRSLRSLSCGRTFFITVDPIILRGARPTVCGTGCDANPVFSIGDALVRARMTIARTAQLNQFQNQASAPETLVIHKDFTGFVMDFSTNVPVDLKPIVYAIIDEYPLPPDGFHGVAHWARVLENGMRLSAETGASGEVVALFSVFHDSCRVNEGYDPEHGSRGAEFAARLRGKLFELTESDFNLLYRACVGHTHEHTHPDITIQTCWDADRLDLGRVGITPHPSRLCTEYRQGQANDSLGRRKSRLPDRSRSRDQ